MVDIKGERGMYTDSRSLSTEDLFVPDATCWRATGYLAVLVHGLGEARCKADEFIATHIMGGMTMRPKLIEVEMST